MSVNEQSEDNPIELSQEEEAQPGTPRETSARYLPPNNPNNAEGGKQGPLEKSIEES